MGTRIELFDTTLRDGTQSEGINLSLEEKVRIAQRLDLFGVTFIEGGWPGSNPKDIGFFKRIQEVPLVNAKITAFGSTRHAKNAPEDDPNLLELVRSKAPAAAIFGKSWILHVRNALRVEPDVNLDMIRSSIEFLKANGMIVVYDAEHFFDGYKDDAAYALETVLAAQEGGADRIVFCDTNGGCLPQEVSRIVGEIKPKLNVSLGIHTHNDGGLAVANTLAAVISGCTHVQGTINGIGERCGNVDLTSVIPNLQLKMGYEVVSDEQLRQLKSLADFVAEIAHYERNTNQPFVGNSAFAHKGGIHVSAVQRDSKTYEHIEPEKIGNRQRILISELSGKSNIMEFMASMNLNISDTSPVGQAVLRQVKEKENQGYLYESASASLEILIKRELGLHKRFFETVAYRVLVDQTPAGNLWSEATVRINIGGKEHYEASDGDGPVNALDRALRKALERYYSGISEVELIDFNVRIIDADQGTGAKTRVLITSSDGDRSWVTIGVSTNIIEASWEALVDSVDYKLLLEEHEPILHITEPEP